MRLGSVTGKRSLPYEQAAIVGIEDSPMSGEGRIRAMPEMSVGWAYAGVDATAGARVKAGGRVSWRG
jgi:hypothetical protein